MSVLRCDYDDAETVGPLVECGNETCHLRVCGAHLSVDGLCDYCADFARREREREPACANGGALVSECLCLTADEGVVP